MVGPQVAATAPTADQTLIAKARRAGGKVCSSNASDVDMTIAAPKDWTTRKLTSDATFQEAPAAAEAVVNTTMPDRNRRRRPNRSASRPAGASSAAKPIV